jgi:hypothetical protein
MVLALALVVGNKYCRKKKCRRPIQRVMFMFKPLCVAETGGSTVFSMQASKEAIVAVPTPAKGMSARLVSSFSMA